MGDELVLAGVLYLGCQFLNSPSTQPFWPFSREEFTKKLRNVKFGESMRLKVQGVRRKKHVFFLHPKVIFKPEVLGTFGDYGMKI